MPNRILPIEVSNIDRAFGGDVKKLLPPMNEIPAEFKSIRNNWNELIEHWFYKGLKKLDVIPREGVDREKAIAHVQACMASWEPKHEHKMAGCAYLMSQFFEDEFSYETGGL